jgi:peptide/nickel transport system substrate-binding protein
VTGGIDLCRCGRWAEQALHRVAWRQVKQDECQRYDTEHDTECTRQTEDDAPGHATNVDLSVRRCLPLWLIGLTLACSSSATRRGKTIIFASGADLQSANPLLTTHPLARQVQRYVLLTTLVQYDSALTIRPYLASGWDWSRDSLTLTWHLNTSVRWHDGTRTTARDVAWTLGAARDPATGYPRLSDLEGIVAVTVRDDSTVAIAFSTSPHGIPDVFTDLAILPAHVFAEIPHGQVRAAVWNQAPVGNGPFRFVSHTPNRRWVFAANPDFPAALGGPPRIDRLVIAIVDEPTTKLAALTAGELDFAGIQPAHASFVRKDPRLAVIEYPLLFTYGLVFNTRRPPFNDATVRRAIALAIDRPAIVGGYLFGFGTAASLPLLPDSAPGPDLATAKRLIAGRAVRFEMLTVGSGDAALEQMLQTQLEAIGVHAIIRQLELTTFLDRVQGFAHDFDAAVMGISGDVGLGHLAPLLATTGLAHTGDRNAMLRLFADSIPVAFLYHAGGVQGMNRRVRGVRMDVRGELATLRAWDVDR